MEDITLRPNSTAAPIMIQAEELMQEITARRNQVETNDGTLQPGNGTHMPEPTKAEAISPANTTAPKIDTQVAIDLSNNHTTDPQHCTYCGAHMSPDDQFCPECGERRGELICPNCHTATVFSYCPQCGLPLTANAKQLTAAIEMDADFQEMNELTLELNHLDRIIACDTEGQIQRSNANEDFRRHILSLLDGEAPAPKSRGITTTEKDERREALIREISQRLQKMSAPVGINRAETRNRQMAIRPRGLRSGWVCNFKHEEHPSPCACAHPEMGGHWIIKR